MLENIRLVNFKVARNLDLPLAPLTLLSGLNGSGKSTVLQSLAAIRQSYLSNLGGGLHLGGPLVQLGKGVDVLSMGASDETVTIAVLENGVESQWICKATFDTNQLEFIETPSIVPTFAFTQHFQYLQADRIVPHTLYPQADEHSKNAKFLGAHGEFTADFLCRNQYEIVSERRLVRNGILPERTLRPKVTPTNRMLDQVAGWLQQVSPGARLKVELLPGTDEVILQFQYVGQALGIESNYYRPTNVGFGLTYSLPILVACLAAPVGALLLIENPEAHLHPKGQTHLGELLATCAADGVQILVETHSDHVLNGIRLAVKKNLVEAHNIRLCYFTRDIDSGDCYVELPSVMPNGRLSSWPNGFFDEWEKSLDALLD